jgi:hypothetical protein
MQEKETGKEVVDVTIIVQPSAANRLNVYIYIY